MPLGSLFNYYKVKSSPKPHASVGVSLACSDTGPQKYIAYLGKGYQNVWYLRSTNEDDPVWLNEQVKIEGQRALVAGARPVIIVFKGQPTIVSIDPSEYSITVSSFDGAQWIAASTPLQRPADAVCAVVLKDILFVFFTASGSIFQLTVPDLPPAAFGPPELKFPRGDKGAPPTWAHSLEVCLVPKGAYDVFLFSVPWQSGNAAYMSFNLIPDTYNLPAPQTIEPNLGGGVPLFTQYAAAVALGADITTYLYLGQGKGSQLFSADSYQRFTASPPITLKLLTAQQLYYQPKSRKNKITAQHQPSLVLDSDPDHDTTVYFAHQGGDSGDIWFGYGEIALPASVLGS